MKPSDIKRIAAAAESHGERILAQWLQGGKRSGKNYTVRNPNRDDHNAGSLVINVDNGKGADFATGEAFGDFVGLVAFALRCDMSAAAEALAEFLGISITSPAVAVAAKAETKKESEWTSITPVPASAGDPPRAHRTNGIPSLVHTYRDAAGQLLGFVYRWTVNPPKLRRKKFAWLTWGNYESGAFHWDFKAWSGLRPLYGLDELARKPNARVVLHEGENSADAGRRVMPEFASITWPGGSSAVDKADFGPLAGRDVLLWQDNDASGREAMEKAAKALKKANVGKVAFINLEAFQKTTVSDRGQLVDRLAELPIGWDCADAEAEGWTPQALAELLSRDDALLESLTPDTATSEEPVKPATTSKTSQRFGPYLYDAERGLFFVEQKDGEDVEQPICGPLLVPALARDGEGGGWSPVLEFIDRDGQQRREIIPYKLFLGLGFDGIKLLADMGLEIASNTKAIERLRNYIVGAKPHRRARLFEQTGWHKRVFRLPDCAIGETDETMLFRGRAAGLYSTRGTLANWQSHIAHPANGNPRLMFSLSAAFGGSLLLPLERDSFALHWGGASSTGKTGAGEAASSVWGNPENEMISWRQTSNALEYQFQLRNDGFAPTDELKQGNALEVAQIIYMHGNERGKGRAHHAGGLRESTAWRNIMLSTGEIGMEQMLAQVHEKHYDGQAVRFIELEADGGAGHGMWNNVACVGGGKQFTDNLKKFAGRYYGTAGRAFLVMLVKNLDQLPGWWRNHVAIFDERYKSQEAGGQVLRVMSAFCLVAFAGELASQFEVVPWTRGAATDAAGQLFTEWAAARPSIGNGEESKIIAHVRGVMERSWKARFDDWQRIEKEGADISRANQVIDPLGFRKADVGTSDYFYYVMRGRFADEFGTKGGFKHKRVAAVLKKHGVLQCDKDGTTYRETLPNGDPRSYCIIGKKLWALEL